VTSMALPKNSIVVARARRYGCSLYCALSKLLEDTQHASHHCGDTDCPVEEARAVLALVDGLEHDV
jgi:hypothetical protein